MHERTAVPRCFGCVEPAPFDKDYAVLCTKCGPDAAAPYFEHTRKSSWAEIAGAALLNVGPMDTQEVVDWASAHLSDVFPDCGVRKPSEAAIKAGVSNSLAGRHDLFLHVRDQARKTRWVWTLRVAPRKPQQASAKAPEEAAALSSSSESDEDEDDAEQNDEDEDDDGSGDESSGVGSSASSDAEMADAGEEASEWSAGEARRRSSSGRPPRPDAELPAAPEFTGSALAAKSVVEVRHKRVHDGAIEYLVETAGEGLRWAKSSAVPQCRQLRAYEMECSRAAGREEDRDERNCHQCHNRNPRFITCRQCARSFCDRCIRLHHYDDGATCGPYAYVCAYCRRICRCASCLRRRTGSLAPAPRKVRGRAEPAAHRRASGGGSASGSGKHKEGEEEVQAAPRKRRRHTDPESPGLEAVVMTHLGAAPVLPCGPARPILTPSFRLVADYDQTLTPAAPEGIDPRDWHLLPPQTPSRTLAAETEPELEDLSDKRFEALHLLSQEQYMTKLRSVAERLKSVLVQQERREYELLTGRRTRPSRSSTGCRSPSQPSAGADSENGTSSDLSPRERQEGPSEAKARGRARSDLLEARRRKKAAQQARSQRNGRFKTPKPTEAMARGRTAAPSESKRATKQNPQPSPSEMGIQMSKKKTLEQPAPSSQPSKAPESHDSPAKPAPAPASAPAAVPKAAPPQASAPAAENSSRVSYKTLGLFNTRKMFSLAVDGGFAVPAFNFNNMEQLQAIIMACVECRSPVILQVSKGARNYANQTLLKFMAQGAVEYSRELSQDGSGIPIALNLDHGDSYELCAACVDSGFSNVMIDGSHLPFAGTRAHAAGRTHGRPAENIALTKKVVDYAHKYDVTVEGELGVLAGVEDDVSAESSSYTKPDQAVEFVKRTGVDSLAISIGTSHGAFKFKVGQIPQLRIDILHEIAARLPGFPIVLHGSSSVPPEHVVTINEHGGHIDNAIGIPEDQIALAVKSAVCKHMDEHPDQYDPRQYFTPARESLKQMYIHKCKDVLFSADKSWL
eukprot:m51a1_g163 putative fructose-bisphosphate aldolase (1022) ;mRNA; r:525056-529487